MNQTAETVEIKKQEKEGLLKRLAAYFAEKMFSGFCTYSIGASPYETWMYMTYSGYGWEEAMMAQSLTRLKMDDEV